MSRLERPVADLTDRPVVPRWLGCRMLSATACLLLATSTAATETASGARPLAPGSPIERTLAAGETHLYDLAAEAGEAWLVAVEQRGIDVAVEVRDPAGESLGTVAGPLGRWDRETVLVQAAAAGRHRVEVRPQAARVAPGRYVLSLERLDAATPAQRLRLAAELAATSGGRFAASARAEERERAIAFYRRARYLWDELGDPFESARATHAFAELSRRNGELDAAVDGLQAALAAWRALGEPGYEAEALFRLGLARLRQRAYPEARRLFTEARDLHREIGRAVEAADDLLDLALVDQYQGALRRALAGYQETYSLYREAGHLEHEGTLLNNLGGIYSRLGEPRQAMEHYRRALELYRDAGDVDGEIAALNNLAVLHRYLWQPDKALELYARALELSRELGERRRETLAYNNIGYAYLELGELERAREYLERALAMRLENGNERSAAATLKNLADLYERRGDLAAALVKRRQALALVRQTGDEPRLMGLLSLVGRDLIRLEDAAAARIHFDEALALLDGVEDSITRAEVLHRRGEALLALGEVEEASIALERALELRRLLSDRAGELETLLALARAERRRGRLPRARERLAEARAVVETLRAEVRPPYLRAAFLGSRREVYELSIDAAMELHAREPRAGHDREALELSERIHARGLLDLLAEAGTELEHGVEPELRQRRGDLVGRLAILTGHLDRAASGSRRLSSEEISDVVAELADVRAALDRVEAQIRRANPRYEALTHPEPLAASAMQQLLGDGELLLHYALGEERSFLWAVTAERLEGFVLPPRAEIEDAARRAHEELRTRASSRSGPAAAAALAEKVLGPAAGRLVGGRLVVVADGALHYVPFAALPLPAAAGRPPGERLLARYEVVHLPSLSTLSALPEPAPGRPTVAVFADPVFDPHDRRVVEGKSHRVSASRGPADSVVLENRYLERLPDSRREAEAIARLVPPEDVLLALDFDANHDRLADLARYRIVHFATHGEIDARDPRLSRLVLSRVDRHGKPRDGALRLADVYNLDLDADLVVLSGCDTALGREIRGEGLVGLTRGFFYAGARRVVASLWPVQDQATAELMERFYRSFLKDGLAPPAALRAAQVEISRHSEWSAPFYWAAFVIQGDWRSPAAETTTSSKPI